MYPRVSGVGLPGLSVGRSSRVYPRACGEWGDKDGMPGINVGLSPRLRGDQRRIEAFQLGVHTGPDVMGILLLYSDGRGLPGRPLQIRKCGPPCLALADIVTESWVAQNFRSSSSDVSGRTGFWSCMMN